jgi:hypothetical protein
MQCQKSLVLFHKLIERSPSSLQRFKPPPPPPPNNNNNNNISTRRIKQQQQHSIGQYARDGGGGLGARLQRALVRRRALTVDVSLRLFPAATTIDFYRQPY